MKLRRGIDIGGETFIGLAASAVKPVVAAKADYDFLLKWIGAGMPDKMRVSRVLGIIAELERVRYDLCSLNTTEQEKIPVLLSPRTKVDEIDRDSDKLREFLRALLETVTA